jgi:hypothetical protein
MHCADDVHTPQCYLLTNGRKLFSDPLDSEDMFVFGHFSSATDTDFFMWELVLFAAMGAIVSNRNMHMLLQYAHFRYKHVHTITALNMQRKALHCGACCQSLIALLLF